jgi:hypothetical protein
MANMSPSFKTLAARITQVLGNITNRTVTVSEIIDRVRNATSIAGVNDFAGRTRNGAEQIQRAVGEPTRQASAPEREARQFIAGARAA